MRFDTLAEHLRLLFRKEKEPFLRLRQVLGFLPHDLSLYRLALMHKSVGRHDTSSTGHGRLNNERLEFLGDAVLGCVVADLLYQRYPTRQEGFLTTLRSKLVRRDMLNDLAVRMGLDQLVLHTEHVSTAHNSYMNGNAFEAFVGAIYLDRGYRYCLRFVRDVVFARYVDVEKVARTEENYKSRLIEWCQKRGLSFEFEVVSQRTLSDRTTAKFVSRVLIEGEFCGSGDGYSKKESHQNAARQAWKRLHKGDELVRSLMEKHQRAQEDAAHEPHS